MKVFPYSVLELEKSNGETFKVNGQRVKHYEDGVTHSREVFQRMKLSSFAHGFLP